MLDQGLLLLSHIYGQVQHTHAHTTLIHLIVSYRETQLTNISTIFCFPFISIPVVWPPAIYPLFTQLFSLLNYARPGCRVEAGAEVSHAILCDGAVVKRGARVGRGCGTCVHAASIL